MTSKVIQTALNGGDGLLRVINQFYRSNEGKGSEERHEEQAEMPNRNEIAQIEEIENRDQTKKTVRGRRKVLTRSTFVPANNCSITSDRMNHVVVRGGGKKMENQSVAAVPTSVSMNDGDKKDKRSASTKQKSIKSISKQTMCHHQSHTIQRKGIVKIKNSENTKTGDLQIKC